MQQQQNAAMRAVRLPRVCDLTGASPATIWRWVRLEAGFPLPFHLSAAVTAWDEGEVIAWLEQKKAQRGKA